MPAKFNMDGAFKAVRHKFAMYENLLRGVAEGRIRHLFVEGPQGIGKTYAATKILGTYEERKKVRLHRAAGRSTPLALYNDLYEMRYKGDISLFDDCDSVFKNRDGLNLLKAATDTIPDRELAWASSSRHVVCPRYAYDGSIVVLTNEDLSAEAYAPLADRVHILRMGITTEEKVARIIEILRTDAKFSHCHDAVTMWLIEHHAALGPRLSIRTAIKCLELAAYNQDDWQDLAEATILLR